MDPLTLPAGTVHFVAFACVCLCVSVCDFNHHKCPRPFQDFAETENTGQNAKQ